MLRAVADLLFPASSWTSWHSPAFLRLHSPSDPLISVRSLLLPAYLFLASSAHGQSLTAFAVFALQIFCQPQPGDFPSHPPKKVPFHDFLDEWEYRALHGTPSKACEASESVDQIEPDWKSLPDVFCGNEHISHLSEALAQDLSPAPFDNIEERGRLWMGNRGHVSHLHFDAHHGLLLCLSGSKHLTLYDPVANINKIEKMRGSNAAVKQTAQKTGAAAPIGLETLLSPGDAVFIPLYWWHLVSCETDSVALNFWAYPDLLASTLKFSSPFFEFTALLLRELVDIYLQDHSGATRFALITESECMRLLDQILRGKRGDDEAWTCFIQDTALPMIRALILRPLPSKRKS